MFVCGNRFQSNDLVYRIIPSLVIQRDNALLINLPFMEEVKNDAFSMNGTGAPGPDGFGGHFYHTYWDVIAQEVYNVVLQIL